LTGLGSSGFDFVWFFFAGHRIGPGKGNILLERRLEGSVKLGVARILVTTRGYSSGAMAPSWTFPHPRGGRRDRWELEKTVATFTGKIWARLFILPSSSALLVHHLIPFLKSNTMFIRAAPPKNDHQVPQAAKSTMYQLNKIESSKFEQDRKQYTNALEKSHSCRSLIAVVVRNHR
jgi:hypothetical protein